MGHALKRFIFNEKGAGERIQLILVKGMIEIYDWAWYMHLITFYGQWQ